MSSIAATTIASSPQRHHQQSLPQPQPQQSPLKKREINLTDDPDKLLNDWLGELENLIGVSWLFILFHNYIYWKVFNDELCLFVRSLWNFKSNVKNWCRHFEHWNSIREKKAQRRSCLGHERWFPHQQQQHQPNQWFSKTKYLQAICALLCIRSVFVDFSIIKSLKRNDEKKEQVFWIPGKMDFHFILFCRYFFRHSFSMSITWRVFSWIAKHMKRNLVLTPPIVSSDAVNICICVSLKYLCTHSTICTAIDEYGAAKPVIFFGPSIGIMSLPIEN